MTAGPRQLEQQGLIDAQRIDRIRPLITGDAMTEERACRKLPHLSNEDLGLDAGGACAELIPVPAGAITGFCIATLIADRGQEEGQVSRLVLETAIGPVLAVPEGKDSAARWEGWTATGVETQDPPCPRAARQGPAPPRWRSAAEPNDQPGWLV